MRAVFVPLALQQDLDVDDRVNVDCWFRRSTRAGVEPRQRQRDRSQPPRGAAARCGSSDVGLIASEPSGVRRRSKRRQPDRRAARAAILAAAARRRADAATSGRPDAASGADLSRERDPQRRSRRCRTRWSRRSICARSSRSLVEPTTRGLAADRAERLGGARPRRQAGRPRDARLLRLGGARPAASRAPPSSSVAAIVPIAGPAADRDLAPVYPGHHRRGEPARLGSAVSDRSAPRSPTSTKSTGSSIARRRRRSCPLESGRRSGDRATAR